LLPNLQVVAIPMFDPYRDWLDIPPEQQPPTHYRLLGVAPAEANVEAIKEAALLQTTRVRMYQTGQKAEVCTRLLNEIAQARAVLVNPKTRQEYDARLAAPAVVAPAAPEPAATVTTTPSASMPRPGWPRPDRMLAAMAYCCLLLFGFGISFCVALPSKHKAAETPTEKPVSGKPASGDGQP
jgi:hypothetical protein